MKTDFPLRALGHVVLDLKTIVTSFGILTTVFGIYMVYYFLSLNSNEIDGGNASTDFEKIHRETVRRRLRFGVYVVLIGTTIQLISNFIPSGIWTH